MSSKLIRCKIIYKVRHHCPNPPFKLENMGRSVSTPAPTLAPLWNPAPLCECVCVRSLCARTRAHAPTRKGRTRPPGRSTRDISIATFSRTSCRTHRYASNWPLAVWLRFLRARAKAPFRAARVTKSFAARTVQSTQIRWYVVVKTWGWMLSLLS